MVRSEGEPHMQVQWVIPINLVLLVGSCSAIPSMCVSRFCHMLDKDVMRLAPRKCYFLSTTPFIHKHVEQGLGGNWNFSSKKWEQGLGKRRTVGNED